MRGRAGGGGTRCALGLAAPAGPQTEDVHAAVRNGFGRLLGGPAELQADFAPDLHQGSSARLSLHARGARVGTLEVDEVWIQVVGVVFDGDALRRGELRATEVREAALHAHIPIRATRVTDRHGVVSSQEDLSKPCVFCLSVP